MTRSVPSRRKPRSDSTEVQFKLLLPRALYARLEGAAEEEGRSVSQEIRRRLEQSFGSLKATDAETRKLLDAINLVAQVPGAWHRLPRSFATFQIALEDLLEVFRPSGNIDAGDISAIEADGHMLSGVAIGALELTIPIGKRRGRPPARLTQGEEK